MHPYLRERANDFRKYGFCVIEGQLTLDRDIMNSAGMQEFTDAIMFEADGIVPMFIDLPNGDLEVRKPSNQREMLVALQSASTEPITGQDYADDGRILPRRERLAG